jgi:putative ABC transport system substrate-binding protein
MERFLPAFNQGLAADTGYVVGRNVTIESPEGDLDRLPQLAADLVRRHVTVIVAAGGRPAQAAKAATQTIPVIFAMTADPVRLGVVASLNRPSGNLTGVTIVGGNEIAARRFELLHKFTSVPTSLGEASVIG